MATGPESLTSRRKVRRQAFWKGKWASVERHGLQRPPSVLLRRSTPFSNSTLEEGIATSTGDVAKATGMEHVVTSGSRVSLATTKGTAYFTSTRPATTQTTQAKITATGEIKSSTKISFSSTRQTANIPLFTGPPAVESTNSTRSSNTTRSSTSKFSTIIPTVFSTSFSTSVSAASTAPFRNSSIISPEEAFSTTSTAFLARATSNFFSVFTNSTTISHTKQQSTPTFISKVDPTLVIVPTVTATPTTAISQNTTLTTPFTNFTVPDVNQTPPQKSSVTFPVPLTTGTPIPFVSKNDTIAAPLVNSMIPIVNQTVAVPTNQTIILPEIDTISSTSTTILPTTTVASISRIPTTFASNFPLSSTIPIFDPSAAPIFTASSGHSTFRPRPTASSLSNKGNGTVFHLPPDYKHSQIDSDDDADSEEGLDLNSDNNENEISGDEHSGNRRPSRPRPENAQDLHGPPFNNGTLLSHPGHFQDLSDHSSSNHDAKLSDSPSSDDEKGGIIGTGNLSLPPLASKTLVDADRKRLSTVVSTETLVAHPESSTTWTETLKTSVVATPSSVALNPAVPGSSTAAVSATAAPVVTSGAPVTTTSRTLAVISTAPVVANPVIETTVSGSIVISSTLLPNDTATTPLAVPTGKHKDKHSGDNSNDDDNSDDNSDGQKKPGIPGLDNAHKGSSNSPQNAGITSGLSETAEHAVISSVSIASFALLCASTWFIMRMIKNKKKRQSGAQTMMSVGRGSGDDSSQRTSRNIVAKVVNALPFFKNRSQANQQMRNLEAGTVDSRSISSGNSWSLNEKAAANATVLPAITTTGPAPIIPQAILNANTSPVSSSGRLLTPPVMPAATGTRNSAFSFESSQNSMTSEPAPFTTSLQPMPATVSPAPSDFVGTNLHIPISALTSEGTMMSYTSSQYTQEPQQPYTTGLAHSNSTRSAQAQYGGEETLVIEGDPQNGTYRYSELSSISSGFGDNDIILPPSTNASPVAGRGSLSPPNMVRKSIFRTNRESRASWAKTQRDTVMTNVTDDNSPARFRTISSWVQHQTGRIKREQHKAAKEGVQPTVPDEPQLTLMMPDGEVPRPVDMNMNGSASR